VPSYWVVNNTFVAKKMNFFLLFREVGLDDNVFIATRFPTSPVPTRRMILRAQALGQL
jgi:hypothetical protein